MTEAREDCKYATFGISEDNREEWHCHYLDWEEWEPCRCKNCVLYQHREEN